MNKNEGNLHPHHSTTDTVGFGWMLIFESKISFFFLKLERIINALTFFRTDALSIDCTLGSSTGRKHTFIYSSHSPKSDQKDPTLHFSCFLPASNLTLRFYLSHKTFKACLAPAYTYKILWPDTQSEYRTKFYDILASLISTFILLYVWMCMYGGQQLANESPCNFCGSAAQSAKAHNRPIYPQEDSMLTCQHVSLPHLTYLTGW